MVRLRSIRWEVIILLCVFLHSGKAQGFSCHLVFAKLFPFLSWSVQKTEHFPELEKTYSKKVFKKAIEAFEKAKADFPRDPSLTPSQKLQPFVEIEQALADIQAEKKFDVDHFAQQVALWKNKEEMFPYLYRKLSLFEKFKYPLLEKLKKTEESMAEAFWIDGESTPTAVTFSFEKETHTPLITDWVRPPTEKESDWLGHDHKTRKNKLDIIALAGAPLQTVSGSPRYLGAPERELHMPDYATFSANNGTPPIEIKHRSFEINLHRLFQEMREVSKQLGEENSFHVHLAFPYGFKEKEEFKKIGIWWKYLNDSLYLSGLEEGLHPSQLTRLPSREEVPTEAFDLANKQKKFFGIGFRMGLYGRSPNPGDIMVGFELRDISKTLNQFESITYAIAEGISQKKWRTFDPTQTLQLLGSENEYYLFFDKLRDQGLSDYAINALLRVEPLLFVPLHEFDSVIEKKSKPADQKTEKEIFNIASSQYLEAIGKTGKQFEDYLRQKEMIEDDILRTAVRMSLSDWAKETKPSRFFPLY